MPPKIRQLNNQNKQTILEIVNDGARAYIGAIPDELWKDPFFSESYFDEEIKKGVVFYGYELGGELLGVMGIQNIDDVTLLRHSYIRTQNQKQGIGSHLIRFHLTQNSNQSVLVGCLKAMTWAIDFYQKHGFILVDEETKFKLRQKYWSLSSTHIQHSVVLANTQWIKNNTQKDMRE